MAISNRNVAEAWSRGRAAEGGNVRTDGRIFYSYAEPIAARLPDGSVLVTSDRWSVTTSAHTSLARSFAPSGADVRTVPMRGFAFPDPTYPEGFERWSRRASDALRGEAAALREAASRARSRRDSLEAEAASRERLAEHVAALPRSLERPSRERLAERIRAGFGTSEWYPESMETDTLRSLATLADRAAVLADHGFAESFRFPFSRPLADVAAHVAAASERAEAAIVEGRIRLPHSVADVLGHAPKNRE